MSNWLDNFKLDAPYEDEVEKIEEEGQETDAEKNNSESEPLSPQTTKKEKGGVAKVDPSETNTETSKKSKKKEEEVEEEKEEETEKDSNKEEEEEEVEELDSEHVKIMESLVEKGILTQDEDKEGYTPDEEGLSELIEDTIKLKVKEELSIRYSKLGEEEAKLVKYLEEGGKLQTYLSVSEVDYENVNMENEINQKMMITQFLRSQDFTDEEIEEELDSIEELGLLEKRAKSAQAKMLKWQKEQKEQLFEEQKKLKEEREKARQEAAKTFRTTVLSKDEVKGFKLSKNEREQLYDYITKPVDKSGKSQFQIDQNDVDSVIANAYLLMKKFNFDKVKQEAEKKAIVKIKQNLSKVSSTGSKLKGQVAEEEETPKENSPVKLISWL